jgi:hypothetical protein
VTGSKRLTGAIAIHPWGNREGRPKAGDSRPGDTSPVTVGWTEGEIEERPGGPGSDVPRALLHQPDEGFHRDREQGDDQGPWRPPPRPPGRPETGVQDARHEPQLPALRRQLPPGSLPLLGGRHPLQDPALTLGRAPGPVEGGVRAGEPVAGRGRRRVRVGHG